MYFLFVLIYFVRVYILLLVDYFIYYFFFLFSDKIVLLVVIFGIFYDVGVIYMDEGL